MRGYIEVLRHYAEIAGIRRQLKARLLRERPGLFIGVDAPDFNLDLEAGLRSRGMKTVHFVCPSIWAWRAERIEKIRAAADHVLCIFPFEPALLAEHGVAASYVGHPLANVIPMTPDRAAARAALDLVPDAQVVALLPGSRRSEVRYLAAAFLRCGRADAEGAAGHSSFVAPILPGLRAEVEDAAAGQRHGRARETARWPVARRAGRLRRHADRQRHRHARGCAVQAADGHRLQHELRCRGVCMQRKQLQPWVGLPNILCREFVVPELLQEAATPRGAGRRHAGTGSTRRTKRRPCNKDFPSCMSQLQRDTPTLCADAIQKVLEG